MPALREYLRSRAVLVAAAVYGLVAITCAQLPLFNSPGYESSFVTALAGSFVAGFLTIHLLRPAYLASDPGARPFPVRLSFLRIVGVQLILLLIPLGILTANMLRVPNCDYLEGLAFYILLPVVAVLFASGLAIFCTVHYRHARLAFIAYAMASFAYALGLGYFTPAIFSYNFFYGYFPGLSYDELLPLGWPLVFFRVVTLGITALLVWWAGIIVLETSPEAGVTKKGLALLRTLGNRYRFVSAIVVVCCVLLYAFRGPLGWESSRGYVQARLGSALETTNFTLYYDSTSTTAEDLQYLAREHEFRLHQVLDAFALPRTRHIASYIYPSAASKRRLIGAGETELAKPWSREVHITLGSVDDALKHELVHVVAADFGVPVLKASFSPGLTEGVAVAVDGSWGYRTLDHYAAAIRSAGIAPSIHELMTPAGFMSGSSSMSYLLAGAFCRFLIDRYGMRPVMQVYRSGDYKAAYQHPLDSLIARWERSVDSVTVGESDRASVDVLFRRPPIFGKMCARVHARRLRDARRLLEERRYDEARSLYSRLYAEGGSYEALSGLLTSGLRTGDAPGVIHLYDSVTQHDPVPRRFLALSIPAGDALWASGNAHRAESLYASVREADISPALNDAAFIRLWALSDTIACKTLVRYFTSDMPDSARIAWLAAEENGVPGRMRDYLQARVFLRMRRYDGAARLLENAGGIEQDSSIEAWRQVAIGDALVRGGRRQEARAWYWTSLNFDARPWAVEAVNDRLARCEWPTGTRQHLRNP